MCSWGSVHTCTCMYRSETSVSGVFIDCCPLQHSRQGLWTSSSLTGTRGGQAGTCFMQLPFFSPTNLTLFLWEEGTQLPLLKFYYFMCMWGSVRMVPMEVRGHQLPGVTHGCEPSVVLGIAPGSSIWIPGSFDLQVISLGQDSIYGCISLFMCFSSPYRLG